MKSTKLSVAVLAFSLGLAGVSDSAMSASSGKIPREHTQGSSQFITGGIGRDEANAMRKVEPHYPLALEFVQHAKPKDEFLADINVTITNAQGETELRTTSDGPYLFAKLPNGKYKVTANENGHSITRTVVVNAEKPANLVFEWPKATG